jgi:hypothetical protein
MKLYDVIPRHTKAYLLVNESLTKSDRVMLAEAGIASDSDLERMFKSIAKELSAKRLTDKNPDNVELDDVGDIEPLQTEEVLNESLVLTLILASPTLLKLLGKLITWVGAKAAGESITHLAHNAHKAFVYPLIKILQGVAWLNNNKWLKANAEPAAELIYAVIMIGVAGSGIMHSLEGITGVKTAIVKLGTNLDTLTHLVVDTLKGKDMSTEILKMIISKVLSQY